MCGQVAWCFLLFPLTYSAALSAVKPQMLNVFYYSTNNLVHFARIFLFDDFYLKLTIYVTLKWWPQSGTNVCDRNVKTYQRIIIYNYTRRVQKRENRIPQPSSPQFFWTFVTFYTKYEQNIRWVRWAIGYLHTIKYLREISI